MLKRIGRVVLGVVVGVGVATIIDSVMGTSTEEPKVLPEGEVCDDEVIDVTPEEA